MRILLAQNATYVPAHGGANKANRLLMEELATKGHACRVVVPASRSREPGATRQFLERLAIREIDVIARSATETVFCHKGVEVHAVTDISQLRAQLVHQVSEFEPAWNLVSSEDPGQVLLKTALRASPSRVVYLAHTVLQLPFGPRCFVPSLTRTKLLQQAAGILAPSCTLGEYIRRWGDLEAIAIPFPVYGCGPFPRFGHSPGCVTMINPCVYKGIAIFVALAQKLPHVPFAAVPTWGTTRADRAALEQLPNVRLWKPVDDIDEIFARTRVLVVPSLWSEAFGQIVVEAMLRGIPVLASDSGGLPEAKLGVDYVLPVRQIEHYEERLDSRGLPVPVVPDQDIAPWLEALQTLLSDRACYERLSMNSREAALTFVSSVGVQPFEEFLEGLVPTSQGRGSDVSPQGEGQDAKEAGVLELSGALPPERRALLAACLKNGMGQLSGGGQKPGF